MFGTIAVASSDEEGALFGVEAEGNRAEGGESLSAGLGLCAREDRRDIAETATMEGVSVRDP